MTLFEDEGFSHDPLELLLEQEVVEELVEELADWRFTTDASPAIRLSTIPANSLVLDAGIGMASLT